MDYRHNSDSKQINIYGHNSVRYDVPFKELEGYIKKIIMKNINILN